MDMPHLHCLSCRWRFQRLSTAVNTKEEEVVSSFLSSNMAPSRRLRRVAASQPGFLNLKTDSGGAALAGGRRKRLNKNKKKSWNKHSDINDVDAFLEDVRLQERTTGGLLSEKSDESLFFLDAGPPKDQRVSQPAEEQKRSKGKAWRPLRIDLILQRDSLVPIPKDVLAYQKPNANNNPNRDYYDMWREEPKDTSDPWFLQQTGKKRVPRPERMNEKPSVLPAVEVIAAGGSYNPEFFSHQALLQEAHNVELKRQKEEDRIAKQLAVNKEHFATEETVMKEQVEGLVEEEAEEGEEEAASEEDVAVGAIVMAEKKTERQRRKERVEKLKVQRRQANRAKSDKRQQLFQLNSIKKTIKERETNTKVKQEQRKSNQEAEKAQPRRLGKLKFQPQDMEVQLSNELAGSLRRLKPEGSVLKDRFKSLQKRNLIEPRERAKFKRVLKVKYVEKRAFREIT
uniref:Ribosome biogenesis protein NOP53 n=1 Tax=Gasterosteus aculeatus aculeatus TaxID=481459 RepID=A0AAQ4Q7A6_GASAC